MSSCPLMRCREIGLYEIFSTEDVIEEDLFQVISLAGAAKG